MKTAAKNKTPKAASKLRDLQPVSNPKGGDSNGKVNIQDIPITKHVDSSSPTLYG